MSDLPVPPHSLPPEVLAHYTSGNEAHRLSRGSGMLELVRTQELVARYLPPPPAVIFDVGGGSGVYALWLAQLGYQVHLIDPLRLHVEQAQQASRAQVEHPIAQLLVGDARHLERPDASVRCMAPKQST